MAQEKKKTENASKIPSAVKNNAVINNAVVDSGKSSGKIIAILVRGMLHVQQDVRDTLHMLKLNHQNSATILENNLSNQGMLFKVKDFVTWGELSPELLKELLDKRGEDYGQVTDRKEKYHYGFLEINGKKYKRYFRLNPPQKG